MSDKGVAAAGSTSTIGSRGSRSALNPLDFLSEAGRTDNMYVNLGCQGRGNGLPFPYDL